MNKYLQFLQVFFMYLFVCNYSFSQTDSAPSITAEGRQAFCTGNPINIVTDFTITDVDDTTIASFFIQISSGYQVNFDRLELIGNYPTISTSWNVNEGKLTLTSSINGTEMLLVDLENAVKDIVFSTTANTIVSEKFFSLSIGDANYLPATDHFYEFIADQGITWTNAKIAAENRTYYGRQGYLATLTSQQESDFAGKQASGAGWIGGSDEETEGEWKWVTGPEAGTVFWRGQVNGTTPNFAFWNHNEPNDFKRENPNGEDYAHITDPSIGIRGAWNDLPNEGGTNLYIPRGYIVEYGKPGDPPLNIAANTSIYIPQITATTNATVCESDTATITATPSEGEVLWYDTPDRNATSELARGNSFTINNIAETTIYYATVSVNGCTTLERIPVTITVNTEPRIVSVTNDLICSGTANLRAEASNGEVNWYESPTSNTIIFTGTTFKTPNLTSTTSYYVEANNANCTSSSRTQVTAEVNNTIPQFSLAQTNYVICKDVGNLNLETTNPQGNYRYVWKKEGDIILGDQSFINIKTSGNYSVYAISEAGCESLEQNIVVTDSEKASITKEDIVIIEDSENNSIQIETSNLGSGNYEFAIDAVNGFYTNNPAFYNLSTGMHTLYIRDRGGCGITTYQFSILAYPTFFTPNSDNQNDFWKIEGYNKDFYTVANIYIYDRYGKLLYIIKQDSLGWDGNYKGKKLPTNTYWFHTVLTDINGYSVEKTGKFSLIRN